MQILAVIAMVLGLVGCAGQGAGTAASPEEAKAYVRNLGLSEVNMEAKESFGGQQLVEITGKITNKGGKSLRKVELTCVFQDPYNQVVLREVVPLVRPDRGGLKQGETKPFRLPFDSIPNSWNQAMPGMVIAGVVFE
jgi:hypothetical protein